jgi:hypothetical protein
LLLGELPSEVSAGESPAGGSLSGESPAEGVLLKGSVWAYDMTVELLIATQHRRT